MGIEDQTVPAANTIGQPPSVPQLAPTSGNTGSAQMAPKPTGNTAFDSWLSNQPAGATSGRFMPPEPQEVGRPAFQQQAQYNLSLIHI